MGEKLKGWFTPVRIATAGLVVVMSLLLFPVSFLAPGSHEDTNCGSPLVFDPQRYDNLPSADGNYWQQFVNRCTLGRTTRLAQGLGVAAVTGLLVTISLVRRRDTEVSPRQADPRG